MKIWVDDQRTPPEKDWVWFVDSEAVIYFLQFLKRSNMRVDVISLDHDLGGDDTTRPVVLWFCEADFWPVEVRVHSANPVGVEWLTGMIDRYKDV